MVFLHHRRGGVDGIYHCVIPVSLNVMQTIYIGVYTANTGKCSLNLDLSSKKKRLLTLSSLEGV